ncbi:MAG: MBL fold metallo-hydrolase [Deltaproteobacteria bacterium HGW-Deltaproteobacteria-13]|nr:MAG: MBL fold metallo-hydrolase [Deltaproteobacteria bacterium HGW-Deltaproteobacteria-13]
MIDEIMPRLYRIIIPLPNSPLKDLNSYVIKSGDRNLIIDTGFNRTVCMEAMQAGLRALDIDLSKTDFMLTHMHSDHTGLVSRLATDTSAVYFSRIDSSVFNENINWQAMMDFALCNGFQLEELVKAVESHPGLKYSPKKIPEFTFLDDGSIIQAGDYRLKCLLTPGHTQGHICLYDENKKILFSGDHVLYDITPHIESWSYEVNSLKNYLDSLDRIKNLPVKIVLPGHRNLFTDLAGRIDELKKHHEIRVNEVLEVLGKNTMSAYDIAAGMTWDIDCESWEQFPVTQKWFAVGEAIAHLRYLESEGRIKRNTDQKIVTFSAH